MTHIRNYIAEALQTNEDAPETYVRQLKTDIDDLENTCDKTLDMFKFRVDKEIYNEAKARQIYNVLSKAIKSTIDTLNKTK